MHTLELRSLMLAAANQHWLTICFFADTKNLTVLDVTRVQIVVLSVEKKEVKALLS